MSLAGIASAEYSITTTNSMYTNPAAWLYVYTGASDNPTNWDNGSNWKYYESVSDDTASSGSNTPVNADPAFIGYDFAFVDGKQVLTANDTAIKLNTVARMGGGSRFYLGRNVTLQGVDNLFSANNTVSFDFGDFGGTSIISMGNFWMQNNATVNFTGSITMTDSVFSYTVFTSTSMGSNAGTWNASGVTVTDAQGNILQYTTDESKIGTSGYYWIECTYTGVNSPTDVRIVAMSVPEPTTATLSLLALCGLAARRRRK